MAFVFETPSIYSTLLIINSPGMFGIPEFLRKEHGSRKLKTQGRI